MTVTRALRADLFVLRRSRTVWWVALTAVTLGVLLTGSLVYTSTSDEPVADLTTAFGQGEVLIDPLTGLVIAALVASIWGAAHRDGSILWSFMAESSRGRVVLAAVLASALLGITLSALVIVLKIVTLHLTLPAGTEVMWWQDEHGRVAILGALVSGLAMAVLGASASLLTRSASAAIAVLFGWMLVVEPLLVGLLPRSTWTWLPAHAISAIRNAVPDADLGRAGAMVALYTVLIAAAAVLLSTRRDAA